MKSEDELVLGVLLAVKNDLELDVDETLLRGCYEIQQKYQFSEDRTLSSVAMERLIDGLVSRLMPEA